jgi:hypothetical protein
MPTPGRYDDACRVLKKAKNAEKNKNWPVAAKMYTDAATSLCLFSEQESDPDQKQIVLLKATEILDRVNKIRLWIAQQK